QDDAFVERADAALKHIDDVGRILAQQGEVVGPATPCACGSGKPYSECCGRADFDPGDWVGDLQVSEELKEMVRESEDTRGTYSRLDFIFRNTPQSRERKAWVQWHIRDRWIELAAITDMA